MEDKDNIILNLNFFGSFQIKYEGEILIENNWKSKKALNILKFIASRENKKVKKDILLDKFWSKNDKNIKKLHSTIYYLRNTIKNFINNNQICILNYNNGIYSLNSNIFDIDYENLISTYKNARKLEKNNKSHTALQKYENALALYKGDFLKDDLYKDWTREFRQYYREIYIDIILRTSSLIVDLKKDYNRAVELCQKGLDIDSYREELYHSLLSYLIKAGYYGKAAQKYREYSKMLSEEFSIYPGPRTQELFKKINIENNRRLKGNDSYVFQCDKKTFDLIFNLNKRKQERTRESFILLFMQQKNEESSVNRDIINVLNKTLRKGDIICRWNGKILLQLFRADKKASIVIKRRLKKYINKDILDTMEIKYYIIKPEKEFKMEDYVI